MTNFHSVDRSKKVFVNLGMKDHENPLIGSRVVRYRYAGGQTGRQRQLMETHSYSLCRLVVKDSQFIMCAEGVIKEIPPLWSPLLSTKPGLYRVFVFQRSLCESSHSSQHTEYFPVIITSFIIITHRMYVSERHVGCKCVHYEWRERSICDVGDVMSSYYRETAFFYCTRQKCRLESRIAQCRGMKQMEISEIICPCLWRFAEA